MRSLFRPIPTRLLDDARFMRLDAVASDILLRLYLICDRRGRGNADPHVVRSATGRLQYSTDDVEAALTSLSVPPAPGRVGLLRIYDDELNSGRCWQLDRYWEDLTEDMRRKAGVSRYPAPPAMADDVGSPPQWFSKIGWPVEAPIEEPVVEPEPMAPQGRPNSAVTAPRRHRQDVDPEEDPTRVYARARVGPSGLDQAVELAGTSPNGWPSPEHRVAALAWRDELWRRAPMNGHHLVTPGALASVAQMHPGRFVAACREAISQGASWGGWTARWPLNWLRKGCEIAERSKAAPATRAGPQRAKYEHERKCDEDVRPMSVEEFEASLDASDYDGGRLR